MESKASKEKLSKPAKCAKHRKYEPLPVEEIHEFRCLYGRFHMHVRFVDGRFVCVSYKRKSPRDRDDPWILNAIRRLSVVMLEEFIFPDATEPGGLLPWSGKAKGAAGNVVDLRIQR